MMNSWYGHNSKESRSMALGQQTSWDMGWVSLRSVESRLERNGFLEGSTR